MIPSELREGISARLVKEIGWREDVGHFVFTFSALDSTRDTEYALEELRLSTDETFKKAVNIVLEEIAKPYEQIRSRSDGD